MLPISMPTQLHAAALATAVLAATQLHSRAHAGDSRLELQPGDHVCYIGNTLADRMQHHAWLESYLHAQYPHHQLTFRNLGFAGDEVKTRPRSDNFGSPDEWLSKCDADVVFCFFGYNEALRGRAGLADFENDLADMIQNMSSQQYNGRSSPVIVVFSPIAHENLQDPNLPDGSENNQKLVAYTSAMKKVCEENGVLFVDLFSPTSKLYARAEEPLTLNGIHLLEHGNRALAEVILDELCGGLQSIHRSESELKRLRQAVLDKNRYWFSRYRVVDGYNVYGGRSKLAWDGQSNADVMQREMEIFDVMTANRDKAVWAVARGSEYHVDDDNLPSQLEVKPNQQSEHQASLGPYLGGQEAIARMDIAEGMQVNLFASEEMFPRLANPVQMAVDTNSRLWVSVWPSYPHWNPIEERKDALIILPDQDRDGVADECIVFADELNSITGFEFWGGGVLVFAPPEIWYLEDTDGDDRADRKIRMLQGISSADTHHSANAVLIGPDGWLYWSRGIFNVANFETPTKTYRSGQSGVHRFNPRTFEVEFHFPIGPNPHGDVFDQWGYQFANDGTSGTGSYVNIGKGVGNKHWFKKRVRPVPATGILSSSHFPERNQGNFLLCNAIGVLGVLQYEVNYNGADITAEEIEPMVVSSDPHFRPSDLEIGGDGALYISDWYNALIGHMQHNMRDPHRDHTHGRVYRVTYQGRQLLEPAKMGGKPIEQVCEFFFAKENGTRYRARLELSGRETSDVVDQVGSFAARLDPLRVSANRDEAQALLECLWVFEEHRVPNAALLSRVVRAAEPRVRAAAIRSLGHWGEQIDDWPALLSAAARDDSALVRAEAVKAAVSFTGLPAAEIIFEVAQRPLDPELQTVLEYARGQINIDAVVRDALRSKTALSPAAQAYILRHAKVEDLMKMEQTEAILRAVLSRPRAGRKQLRQALSGLARLKKQRQSDLLLELIEKGDADDSASLGTLLLQQPIEDLRLHRQQFKQMALEGETARVRRVGYAAWIAAAGALENPLSHASTAGRSLRELLESVPLIPNSKVPQGLYASLQQLLFELSPKGSPENAELSRAASGIQVEYYLDNPTNAARETFAKMRPTSSGIVGHIGLDVPQITRRDGFALRFRGAVVIDDPGEYTFFTSSDDGSRLYVGNELVVNNDGLHGMKESSGTIDLLPGSHPIEVTYFDNGGGDGLAVSWSGPGIHKEPLPAERLIVSAENALTSVAIRALASLPGHQVDKFRDFAALIDQQRCLSDAVRAIRQVSPEHWPDDEIGPLARNLISHIAATPARLRNGKSILAEMQLCERLALRLPDHHARRLQNELAELRVLVVSIGTVPHRMIYDTERLAIQAGNPVEFQFSNTDNMPHNFTIVTPGAMEEVGLLAEATARDKDAIERHYVPKSDSVLLGSHLLQPGQSQTIFFEAPTEPGIYPFVCTYPGHWRRMYGALYIVADLKAYLVDPVKYLANNDLPVRDELLNYIDRDTQWEFNDFAESIHPLPHGRSFEVGKSIFKVANCVACHRLNNEGQVFGPDLTQLPAERHTTEHILRAILKPSQDIEEKYQSHTFILNSGQVVTAMIVEETPTQIKVIADPIASAVPAVIEKDAIDERSKLTASIMPEGLLNKLTHEEILDLIAYVYARGDHKDSVFAEHHGH